ncbi:MAG: DMT family transporter, partial [Actinobacteria bacterium]|nr:DMT family transporter [Actinomycetota bacterium]
MDIALALVAALLFALGTVLQQRAGLEAPVEGPSSGLLVQMARRPVWLIGILADAFGFVAQAAALGFGRLAVVQPLLVSSVVFALPLGVRLTGQKVRRIDIGAAFLVTAALVAFLTFANPSGGRADAPLGDWLITIGACLAVCAPLVIGGRTGPAPRRAA